MQRPVFSQHVVHRFTRRRRARGGLAALVLVLAVSILVGFAALAIDLGKVHYVHQQLLTACRSAALAGAAELMDRTVLYPTRARDSVITGIDSIDHGQNDAPGLSAIAAAIGHDEDSALIQQAMETARTFGTLNYVDGRPLQWLEGEPAESPSVIAGWLCDPADPHSAFEPRPLGGPANSLVVRSQLTERSGNPLGLWLSKFLGTASADVAASARASLDRRVYGVRPAGGALAPIVPLAIHYERGALSWLAQAFAAPQADRSDRFVQQAARHAVQAGADGIPEIRLEIAFAATSRRPSTNSTNATLVRWQAPHGPTGGYDVHQASRWIANGVAESEMDSLGGALLIGQNLAVDFARDDVQMNELRDALLAIRGQTRIWPLIEPHTNGSAEVVSLAAGIVVDAWIDPASGHCVALVQPSVMATGLALAGPHARENPWLAKLELTQ